MLGWMRNVRPEDRISLEKFRNRLKLNSMRECLQDTRLQWFDQLERMEKNAWLSKYRSFKVRGTFPRI